MRKSGNKKNTLKKIMIWCGSMLIALTIIGFFAMNYAVDYVLDSMTNQIVDSALNSIPDEGNEESGALLNDGNIQGAETSGRSDGSSKDLDGTSEDSGGASEDGQVSSGTGSGKQDDSDPNSPSDPFNADLGRGSKAASGIADPSTGSSDKSATTVGSSDKSGGKLTYSAEIPTDKAETVKEEITLKEKATVAGVILKKFDAADLKLFVNLASGGLTIEEKKAAKIKFMDTLTAEEYDKLIVIAAKYGLSQGEKYNETTRP